MPRSRLSLHSSSCASAMEWRKRFVENEKEHTMIAIGTHAIILVFTFAIHIFLIFIFVRVHSQVFYGKVNIDWLWMNASYYMGKKIYFLLSNDRAGIMSDFQIILFIVLMYCNSTNRWRICILYYSRFDAENFSQKFFNFFLINFWFLTYRVRVWNRCRFVWHTHLSKDLYETLHSENLKLYSS